MKAVRIIIKIVLFVGIVAIGVGVFRYFTATRDIPEKKDEAAPPVIVTAQEAAGTDKPVVVTAMGSVMPARTVTVFPEVPGRVIYRNPELMPGGRIARGQTLVRIDPRDYDLGIQQQQASVSAAELNLAREQSLKAVAEKEWSLIADEVKPTEQGRKLALREIQLKNAEVALAAAKSGLEKAELARSRTAIRAPFNAIVTGDFVDVGQVVSGASRIATLVDADSFWVQATVPVDRLSWIQLPGINSDLGSEATVVQKAGPDLEVERRGRVIKLLGDLDPQGKMARVLIEVQDPFGSGPDVKAVQAHAIADTEAGRRPGAEMISPQPVATQAVKPTLPLLLGAYVTVHIKGPTLDKVLQLPRLALRDRNKVWVKNAENKLEIRDVVVVWSRQNSVYVSGNLRAGEEVITSRISTPVEGMVVKTAGDPAAAPAAPQDGKSPGKAEEKAPKAEGDKDPTVAREGRP